jgi:hypothetical protein
MGHYHLERPLYSYPCHNRLKLTASPLVLPNQPGHYNAQSPLPLPNESLPILLEAQLNGAFNYNQTPFTPPGTKVVILKKPTTHRTWDPHGVYGWYLGCPPKHYHCHQVYVTTTASKQIADTVSFPPQLHHAKNILRQHCP